MTRIPLHRFAFVATRAALWFALAAAGAAHADWAVNDKDANEKLKEIEERIGDGNLNKTASNLLKEVQTSVSKLNFVPTLTPHNQLKKISDTSAYIQKACPSQGSGGGAAGAAPGAGGDGNQRVTRMATIASGDASSAMQQVCQQLIQLRVQALNDTIDMSDRFQKYSDQLTAIENNRQSAKTQGDLWANTNESLRTMNKLQAEMGFWRTRLAAYDAAIKFHEGQQNTLSQTAIKGSGGKGGGGGGGSGGGGGGGLPGAGQLIQTGALAAVLKVK